MKKGHLSIPKVLSNFDIDHIYRKILYSLIIKKNKSDDRQFYDIKDFNIGYAHIFTYISEHSDMLYTDIFEEP